MTNHIHNTNRPHSNRIIVLLAVTFICAAAFGAKTQFDNPLPEPQIPPYSVSITDFDGKGDGITDNTASFSKAFAHLRQHGGGHLNVPAGIWLTGPISLESHVNLHLEEGCMLYFSDNIDDYPLFKWDVIGNSAYECISPISAFDKHDISITGTGSIDGRGQAWRPVKKAKLTDGEWKNLCAGGVLAQDGKTWYPSEAVRDFSNERLGSIPHDSITMTDIVSDAITIDFYYGIKGSTGHTEVSESTPVLDSITINGVLCSGARRAIWINGLPEMPAKNIIVSNSTFTSDNGAEIRNVCGITLDNVVLNHRNGRRIVLENATGFNER